MATPSMNPANEDIFIVWIDLVEMVKASAYEDNDEGSDC